MIPFSSGEGGRGGAEGGLVVGGFEGGARGEGGGDCLRVGGGPSGVLGVGSVGMGSHSVFSSYS